MDVDFSVRHDCFEPLGLTITEAAEPLGATRHTLNNLVNGKSGISADMAIRLDKAFGGTECSPILPSTAAAGSRWRCYERGSWLAGGASGG
jgi:addiction module HigA family antidote